ncbi:MAG: lipocalin-like domain-containing protein [Bacteroidota bacterium]
MEAAIKDNILTEIVGTWKLVSWKYENEDGKEVDFFGENPQGILMYDKEGYMNVQIHHHTRPNFHTEGLVDGTAEETERGFKSYVAYYGKYYQEEPDMITHKVEGSLFPNWEGNIQKRYFKLSGNNLTLSTPPLASGNKKINFTLEWIRYTA